MTAEAIAKVVADLQARRAVSALGGDGKGKLFGRLEGKFWIPQHARGNAEHGEKENQYRLRADG